MTDASSPPDPLLIEQIAYYRAIAPEYEDHAIDEPGVDELEAAVDAFGVEGDVLELACGPGHWTDRLARRATSLTAVDAAPEMLARARARVGDRARFLLADLFTWVPDRQFDAVFFGFFLSHVPIERFEAFWELVAGALQPGGRVLFVDDAYRTNEELVDGEASSKIRRRLNDGSAYHIVKVAHRPEDLERRLAALGWDMRVTQTSGPFYFGQGKRA